MTSRNRRVAIANYVCEAYLARCFKLRGESERAHASRRRERRRRLETAPRLLDERMVLARRRASQVLIAPAIRKTLTSPGIPFEREAPFFQLESERVVTQLAFRPVDAALEKRLPDARATLPSALA